MSSQGPNFPGTGADDNSVGTVTWSNPGNITAEDGSVATANIAGSAVTHYLKGTGFGFSIPTGATVNGILVEWKRSMPSGSSVVDSAVRIIKGGAIGTTDKANGSNWPASLTYQSYGGSSDLWGQTWTAADINGSTFGAALSATSPSGGLANVDAVRITVTYTPTPVDEDYADYGSKPLTQTVTLPLSTSSGTPALAAAAALDDEILKFNPIPLNVDDEYRDYGHPKGNHQTTIVVPLPYVYQDQYEELALFGLDQEDNWDHGVRNPNVAVIALPVFTPPLIPPPDDPVFAVVRFIDDDWTPLTFTPWVNQPAFTYDETAGTLANFYMFDDQPAYQPTAQLWQSQVVYLDEHASSQLANVTFTDDDFWLAPAGLSYQLAPQAIAQDDAQAFLPIDDEQAPAGLPPPRVWLTPLPPLLNDHEDGVALHGAFFGLDDEGRVDLYSLPTRLPIQAVNQEEAQTFLYVTEDDVRPYLDAPAVVPYPPRPGAVLDADDGVLLTVPPPDDEPYHNLPPRTNITWSGVIQLDSEEAVQLHLPAEDESPWTYLNSTNTWAGRVFTDEYEGAGLASFPLEQEEPWKAEITAIPRPYPAFTDTDEVWTQGRWDDDAYIPQTTSVPWRPFDFKADEEAAVLASLPLTEEWAAYQSTQLTYGSAYFAADTDEVLGGLRLWLDQEEAWIAQTTTQQWVGVLFNSDEQLYLGTFGEATTGLLPGVYVTAVTVVGKWGGTGPPGV